MFTLAEGSERKYEWVGLSAKPDEYERMREINENASLFIFGSYKYLAIGGGGQVIFLNNILMYRVHFGLSLDEDLAKGTTGKCLTFANEPLNGKPAGLFNVKTIEVWSFK